MPAAIESIEIYPNIRVYKNMFKDISKSYQILTDSLLESEDRLFSPWTQWSIFGTYLNPMFPHFFMGPKLAGIDSIEAKTEVQQNQKDFGLEMMENFHLVTEDYIRLYNIDVDLNETSIDEDGIYFNDDYEGGEIDFVMGDKLVKYKPEAGDLLVFPSGHPDYLTEEGKPYLHGVMPSYNKNKFLSRMYWQKYQRGTDTWYEKEAEFGKEAWANMQPALEEQFRQDHPQRSVIENGVRII